MNRKNSKIDLKHIPRNLILFLLFFLFLQSYSQQEDETIVTDQVWLDYYTYYYFKPKWELYGDAGYRFIPEDFSWQMIHIRPSIRYIALAIWEVHGGVGIFQTINKNDPNSIEIRFWQGARIKWPSFEPVFFAHYARLEERFFFPEGSSLEFNFRFRYRLSVKINIFRFSNKNLLFLPGYAESFFDFGQQIHETYNNRTRFAAGVGYKTNKNWTFEFHFVGQNSRTGQDEEFETADRLYQFKVRRYLFKKEYKNTNNSNHIE